MSDQGQDGGNIVEVRGWATNFHDVGEGEAVLLLHGSGPGVSAFANWRLVLPRLSKQFRCIAPDMLGFGYSARPDGVQYRVDTWVDHAVGLLDFLGIDQCSVIGNSMGGRIALGLANDHPERVKRLVLMGTPGPGMTPTEGLAALRSYEPSMDNMRLLMTEYFAFDASIVTDDLVKARYEASALPGAQETYWAIFHEERHSGQGLAPLSHGELLGLETPALVIHGREDKVVPPECGLALAHVMPNAQLHLFPKCGHWVQIEKIDEFVDLVAWYLTK